MTASPRLFCFGFGFSARAFARRKRADGWAIAATSRSAAGCAGIAADGGEAFRFPLDDAAAALAGATHLLSSAPPADAGDPVLAAHRDAIRGCKSLRWIGYLSATSVYGDRGGARVSETDTLNPVSTRARKRARAEAEWLDLWRRHGLPVHLFRLAGIYGPGRSVLDQVRAGTARRIARPGHAFSRIHVDDIAAALDASIAKPNPGAIYNLCDDEPVASAEVCAFACALLGVAPPPLVPFDEAVAGMSPMAREFWADSRRIDNRRMHDELGVALAYPSYREGLEAILAAEKT